MKNYKFFNGYNGDGGLFFYTTDGVERLRITHHGFVGFGNINPSYRLDISGLKSNINILDFKFFKYEF